MNNKPERISDLLNYLTPENVKIQLTSKSFKGDKKTRYYGVQYSLTTINPEWLDSWSALDPEAALMLPEPNVFVAQRLDTRVAKDTAGIPWRRKLRGRY